jgi:hypothetical protein
MQPRSFWREVRILLIEPMTSSTNSSRSLGQRLASARFARDQTPFIGVEFRSIGGKVFDMQAAVLSQKLLERLSLVGGRIVQNNDHRAPQVAQQPAEKHAHFFLPDIVEVELIIQTEALASRTYRDSGNDRDLVTSALAMIVNRSTALWGPGLGHIRNQEEARFVSKD